MIINFTSLPANLKATFLLSYFSRTTGNDQKITLLLVFLVVVPMSNIVSNSRKSQYDALTVRNSYFIVNKPGIIWNISCVNDE